MAQPAETASLDPDNNPYLKWAVHQNSALSRQGLLERLFTFAFKGLVYPQIWEDPAVDMDALQLGKSDRLITIASGGCNALSYLAAAGPAHITAIDLNPAHIAYNRLKIAGVKHLPDYETFFQFFGAANTGDNLRLYTEYLRPNIDEATRAYWETRMWPSCRKRITLFTKNIYRYGLLGKFIGMVHLAAKLYGRDARKILQARSMSEQRELFETELAPLYDKRFIKWACNLPISLYGLGIPPAQFEALKADSGGNMAELLRVRLRRLACDFPLATNYFAWQAFARSYDLQKREAVPYYLHEDYYQALKDNIDRLELAYTTYDRALAEAEDNSLDCFCLLDAQDWMDDDQLNKLWAEITRTARPGARVIFRTAGHVSILPGRVRADILNQWHYNEAQCRQWHAADRASIYGGFHLYTLKQ